MTNATFYHAGCPVCLEAERKIADGLDRNRFHVEVVHLGQQPARIAEARSAGVKTLPALVIDGQPFHINYGATLEEVERAAEKETVPPSDCDECGCW